MAILTKTVLISLEKLCMKLTKFVTIQNSFNEVIELSLQAELFDLNQLIKIIDLNQGKKITSYFLFF